MGKTISPTALSGKSYSGNDLLARGLGYFSVGLGLAQLLAPKSISHALGMDGHETLIRAYGVRELATGAAILTTPNPEPYVWGRLAGDAVDIATVAATGLAPDNPKRDNAIMVIGVLVGITALDAICAARLTSEKGGQKTAVADYSDRTGFPKPPNAMRGLATDQELPEGFRKPGALHAFPPQESYYADTAKNAGLT